MTARCVGEDCEGVAAPGLRVDLPCRAVVVVTNADLPNLYEDLLVPSQSGAGNALHGRNAWPPLALDDSARQWREVIRCCLVTWVKILHEDFRVSMPADEVPAMSRVVGRWADRLLNTEHADQLVHDFAFLGDARWTAYPARGGGVRVPCPECGERVRLDPAAEQIVCKCGEWGNLDWWWATLSPETREPMTAERLVAWLASAHGVNLAEATLRDWLRLGHIHAVGKAPTGGMPANLYLPHEVAAHALRARGFNLTTDQRASHSVAVREQRYA